MRRYETIYIIRPNASEDDINSVIERTTGVIEQFNGQIVNLDRWGIKKLAYPIKKETQGYYVYCEYAGTPEAVDEIERLFRIDEKSLKYMTIKTQDVFVADEPKPEVEEVSEETKEVPAADEQKPAVAEVSEEAKEAPAADEQETSPETDPKKDQEKDQETAAE